MDVPESEGGNAEYCSKERGPSNCLDGVKGRLVKTPPAQQRQPGGVKGSSQPGKKRTDMLTGTDDSGGELSSEQNGFGAEVPELEADDDEAEYEDDVKRERKESAGAVAGSAEENKSGGEMVCERGEGGQGPQCTQLDPER